jgi:nicotinate-nucleotide adenylyltransferase
MDRFAMLALATNNEARISVSKIEIEVPSRPYTVETLERLNELLPGASLYFVMGADSWMDIRTWREWEKVLTLSNHIVITRPGVSISFDHVTDEIRERIVDMRVLEDPPDSTGGHKIYMTDSVNMDISATLIREKIRDSLDSWTDDVSKEVAKYIEKYQIYS